MELMTERLLLRPVCEGDIEEITRICQDPQIYQNTLLIPRPYTRDHALAWLGTIETSRREGRAGHDFAICLKESGKFIGVIGLSPFNRHDETEAGYWLDRTYWGQGYMTESLKRVIEFALTQGVHRIIARHFSWNKASGRVMEKAGMKQEGVLRQAVKKDGAYLDLVCYGILKDEVRVSPGRDRQGDYSAR